MKGMKKYYTQKIMWYLLTLVFAVLLNFILPRLMPGDPVSTIASKSVEGMTDATAIQKVYEDLGWETIPPFEEKYTPKSDVVERLKEHVKTMIG